MQQQVAFNFALPAADEYDAAQERGEVAKRSDGAAIRDHIPDVNKVVTVTDVGQLARNGVPVGNNKRELPPGLSIDLIMLKLLAHFGSVDKLRDELTRRGKTDPGMREFLAAFNEWNG